MYVEKEVFNEHQQVRVPTFRRSRLRSNISECGGDFGSGSASFRQQKDFEGSGRRSGCKSMVRVKGRTSELECQPVSNHRWQVNNNNKINRKSVELGDPS